MGNIRGSDIDQIPTLGSISEGRISTLGAISENRILTEWAISDGAHRPAGESGFLEFLVNAKGFLLDLGNINIAGAI